MINIFEFYSILIIFLLNTHLADFAPPVEENSNNKSGTSVFSVISTIKNGINHIMDASYKAIEVTSQGVELLISNGLNKLGYKYDGNKEEISFYNSDGKVLIEIDEDNTNNRKEISTDEESPPDCSMPPYPDDYVTPPPDVDFDFKDEDYVINSENPSQVEEKKHGEEDTVKRAKKIDGYNSESINVRNDENQEKEKNKIPSKDVKENKDEQLEEKTKDIPTKQTSDKSDPEETIEGSTRKEDKSVENSVVVERKSEITEDANNTSNNLPNKPEIKDKENEPTEGNNSEKVVKEESKGGPNEIITGNEKKQEPEIDGKDKQINEVGLGETKKQVDNLKDVSKVSDTDTKQENAEKDVQFISENSKKPEETNFVDYEGGKNSEIEKTEEDKKASSTTSDNKNGNILETSKKDDGPVESQNLGPHEEIIKENNPKKETPNDLEVSNPVEVKSNQETNTDSQSKENVKGNLSEKGKVINTETAATDTDRKGSETQDIFSSNNLNEIEKKFDNDTPNNIAENLEGMDETDEGKSFKEGVVTEILQDESKKKSKKDKKAKKKKIKNKLAANGMKVVKEIDTESGDDKITSAQQETIDSLNKLNLDKETIKWYLKMLKKESDLKNKNKIGEPEETDIVQVLEKIGEMQEDKKKEKKSKKTKSKRKEDL